MSTHHRFGTPWPDEAIDRLNLCIRAEQILDALCVDDVEREGDLMTTMCPIHSRNTGRSLIINTTLNHCFCSEPDCDIYFRKVGAVSLLSLFCLSTGFAIEEVARSWAQQKQLDLNRIRFPSPHLDPESFQNIELAFTHDGSGEHQVVLTPAEAISVAAIANRRTEVYASPLRYRESDLGELRRAREQGGAWALGDFYASFTVKEPTTKLSQLARELREVHRDALVFAETLWRKLGVSRRATYIFMNGSGVDIAVDHRAFGVEPLRNLPQIYAVMADYLAGAMRRPGRGIVKKALPHYDGTIYEESYTWLAEGSRNTKTGLFKVALQVEEFLSEGPVEMIRAGGQHRTRHARLAEVPRHPMSLAFFRWARHKVEAGREIEERRLLDLSSPFPEPASPAPDRDMAMVKDEAHAAAGGRPMREFALDELEDKVDSDVLDEEVDAALSALDFIDDDEDAVDKALALESVPEEPDEPAVAAAAGGPEEDPAMASDMAGRVSYSVFEPDFDRERSSVEAPSAGESEPQQRSASRQEPAAAPATPAVQVEGRSRTTSALPTPVVLSDLLAPFAASLAQGAPPLDTGLDALDRASMSGLRGGDRLVLRGLDPLPTLDLFHHIVVALARHEDASILLVGPPATGRALLERLFLAAEGLDRALLRGQEGALAELIERDRLVEATREEAAGMLDRITLLDATAVATGEELLDALSPALSPGGGSAGAGRRLVVAIDSLPILAATLGGLEAEAVLAAARLARLLDEAGAALVVADPARTQGGDLLEILPGLSATVGVRVTAVGAADDLVATLRRARGASPAPAEIAGYRKHIGESDDERRGLMILDIDSALGPPTQHQALVYHPLKGRLEVPPSAGDTSG